MKVLRKIIKKLQIENKTKTKERHELSFWSNKKEIEGTLSNSHYEYFYCQHFNIDKTSYSDKVLMDIGCGPRGSLEWANNAKRRIGVDPLASKYFSELGADKHNMEYISSGSEKIALPNNSCDYIFSFNSLDHVKSIKKTIKEIKRCLKKEGVFLLLVEVNHPPSVCEPHFLTPKSIICDLAPELKADKIEVYKPNTRGLYASIIQNEKFSDPIHTKDIGWLSAKFYFSN